MIPVCDYCGGWINHANRGHVGFCAPRCRDFARAARDEALADAASKRRDRQNRKQQRTLVLT